MKKMVDHLESKTIKSLTCEKIIHEASDSFYWNKSMISIQKEELGRELFCVKLWIYYNNEEEDLLTIKNSLLQYYYVILGVV